MSVEVKVPALGESIVEATVGRWLKQEGDAVEVGEPLVELETEKVNQEISALDNGVLQSILKQEGETVEIGEVLAIVDETQTAGDGSRSSAPATQPTIPTSAAPATESSPPTAQPSAPDSATPPFVPPRSVAQ